MNPSATRYLYQTVRWITHIGTVAAAVYFVLLTIQVFFGANLLGQPLLLKILIWIVVAAIASVLVAVLRWTRALARRRWLDVNQ